MRIEGKLKDRLLARLEAAVMGWARDNAVSVRVSGKDAGYVTRNGGDAVTMVNLVIVEDERRDQGAD